MSRYDLIVVGAGSGGAGAAITAARQGMRVLWIDKESVLGGTGVTAYVSVFQAAYTASPLAREISERLLDRGEAAYLGYTRDTPTGRPIYRIAASAQYEDTIVSRYEADDSAPIVVYTPSGMDVLLREMAAESGRIDLWDRTTFLDAKAGPSTNGLSRITSIDVQRPDGRQTVQATWFVDATADIYLARRAGCSWYMGREPRAQYDGPSAPPRHEFKLNAWSLCFLVHRGPDLISGEPGPGPGNDTAHVGEMPDGGYYINMCFQLRGELAWAMGLEQAREYLLGNIFKRWPKVQRAYGLEDHGIVSIAPRSGIREGPRLIGRHVLTENDVFWGRFGRQHDDCIAFCDFGLDPHDPDKGWTETENGPYGVPFRCLQPKEVDNLLVACRGASFSSLAASAFRLQRSMIELGEAAGAFAATSGIVAPELPPYTYRTVPNDTGLS